MGDVVHLLPGIEALRPPGCSCGRPGAREHHGVAVQGFAETPRASQAEARRPLADLLPGFDAEGRRNAPVGPWQSAAELDRHDVRKRVRKCIDQLPDTHRKLLILRDGERLSTSEVAHLLDVSPALVKTRLHEARHALRALLDPHLRKRGT